MSSLLNELVVAWLEDADADDRAALDSDNDEMQQGRLRAAADARRDCAWALQRVLSLACKASGR